MKTLYISDLDGTLLDNTPKTSEYTNTMLNELMDKGLVFSFATARSYTTAKKVTKGLNMKYPAVVHNGTFIVDKEGNIIVKNTFSKEDATLILDTVLQNKLSPVVYSLIENKEKFSYIKETLIEHSLEVVAILQAVANTCRDGIHILQYRTVLDTGNVVAHGGLHVGAVELHREAKRIVAVATSDSEVRQALKRNFLGMARTRNNGYAIVRHVELLVEIV